MLSLKDCVNCVKDVISYSAYLRVLMLVVLMKVGFTNRSLTFEPLPRAEL